MGGKAKKFSFPSFFSSNSAKDRPESNTSATARPLRPQVKVHSSEQRKNKRGLCCVKTAGIILVTFFSLFFLSLLRLDSSSTQEKLHAAREAKTLGELQPSGQRNQEKHRLRADSVYKTPTKTRGQQKL